MPRPILPAPLWEGTHPGNIHDESVWVQVVMLQYSKQRILVTQAIYRATHTHVLIHNLHMYLSPLSSDITTLAETQRWHTVYWTNREHTHSVSQSRTPIKTKNDVCVNHCIHTCNAIWMLHKAHTKAPGSHAATHIQAQKTIMFNLALFMGFIIEHTCTVRDVDTDRRATWTFIFQI